MKRLADVVMSRSNDNFLVDYFKLVDIWKIAIPLHIQKNTTPVKLTLSGELSVLVHDNIYLQELDYLKNEFLSLLNTNDLLIKSIHYKYAPLKLKNKEIEKYRYELTDESLKIITRSAKKLDGVLAHDTFIAAMTAYFTRYTVNDYKGR